MQSCYDSAARVSKVQGVGSGGLTYANLSYTLNNGTSKTANSTGNSLVETDTTNNRLQMASIQLGTSTNPSSVMSLAYNYGSSNNNGNVLNQTITRFNPTTQAFQTWTQSYGYQDGTGDQLNRLTCAAETPTASGVTCDNNVASTGANWWRTFGYDPFANGWVKLNSNSENQQLRVGQMRVSKVGQVRLSNAAADQTDQMTLSIAGVLARQPAGGSGGRLSHAHKLARY